MFEGPDPHTREDATERRPGLGPVLVLLLLLGFFANAALFGVASDAARRMPDHPTLSPLRGGVPGVFSTDAPSTARATFRPQRGAALLPITFLRVPGWRPYAAAKQAAHPPRSCRVHGDAA